MKMKAGQRRKKSYLWCLLSHHSAVLRHTNEAADGRTAETQEVIFHALSSSASGSFPLPVWVLGTIHIQFVSFSCPCKDVKHALLTSTNTHTEKGTFTLTDLQMYKDRLSKHWYWSHSLEPAVIRSKSWKAQLLRASSGQKAFWGCIRRWFKSKLHIRVQVSTFQQQSGWVKAHTELDHKPHISEAPRSKNLSELTR